jgi:hypothetical protein
MPLSGQYTVGGCAKPFPRDACPWNKILLQRTQSVSEHHIRLVSQQEFYRIDHHADHERCG